MSSTRSAHCPECRTPFPAAVAATGAGSCYCGSCEKAVRPELPVEASTGEGSDGRPRVLVAEESEPVLSPIAELLSRAGYDVRTARDAETTMRLVREFTPDVLLLDLVMPGEDPLSLLRRIRDEEARPPRVLVISDRIRSTEIISRVHALGASGLIPRPALRDTLLFRVQSLLH